MWAESFASERGDELRTTYDQSAIADAAHALSAVQPRAADGAQPAGEALYRFVIRYEDGRTLTATLYRDMVELSGVVSGLWPLDGAADETAFLAVYNRMDDPMRICGTVTGSSEENGDVTFMLEADPGDRAYAGDMLSLRVAGDAVVGADGGPGAISDGARVEAVIDGGIMESYPARARAFRVYLLD